MIEHSVDFHTKYLNNRHVIGRCLTILEAGCANKLGFDPSGEDVDVPNLVYHLSCRFVKYINFVDSNTITLTGLGEQLRTSNKRIKFTAFLEDGKCIFVSDRIIDDIV